MNKELVYFQMKMLQAEIEMNAMIAENTWCDKNGEYPKYRYDSFMHILETYQIYHNAFPFRDDE